MCQAVAISYPHAQHILVGRAGIEQRRYTRLEVLIDASLIIPKLPRRMLNFTLNGRHAGALGHQVEHRGLKSC